MAKKQTPQQKHMAKLNDAYYKAVAAGEMTVDVADTKVNRARADQKAELIDKATQEMMRGDISPRDLRKRIDEINGMFGEVDTLETVNQIRGASRDAADARSWEASVRSGFLLESREHEISDVEEDFFSRDPDVLDEMGDFANPTTRAREAGYPELRTITLAEFDLLEPIFDIWYADGVSFSINDPEDGTGLLEVWLPHEQAMLLAGLIREATKEVKREVRAEKSDARKKWFSEASAEAGEIIRGIFKRKEKGDDE